MTRNLKSRFQRFKEFDVHSNRMEVNMEAFIAYMRDAVYMVDLGTWQMWQHLEFCRMLAQEPEDDPPDDGGTKMQITALWRRFLYVELACFYFFTYILSRLLNKKGVCNDVDG